MDQIKTSQSKDVKRINLLENAVFWAIVVVLFASSFFVPDDMFTLWVMMSPFLAGLLIHHYLYVPSFLFTNQYITYLFLLLLLILGVVFASEAVVDLFNVNMGLEWTKFIPYESTTFSNTIIVILVVGADCAIRMIFNNVRQKIVNAEKEKQMLDKKMEFLMFQISPHFLMNTLNNIHALVDSDTLKAKDAIVSLSRLLRYMLYETSVDGKVSLERQIKVIRAYCELFLLRYGNNVKINIGVPNDLPHVLMPPLIFIVFIENAFKHGIVYGKESVINVNIWVETESLHFTVSNPFIANKVPANPGGASSPIKQGGVGLKNVVARLDMLYGENYKLISEVQRDEYMVHLSVPIE